MVPTATSRVRRAPGCGFQHSGFAFVCSRSDCSAGIYVCACVCCVRSIYPLLHAQLHMACFLTPETVPHITPCSMHTWPADVLHNSIPITWGLNTDHQAKPLSPSHARSHDRITPLDHNGSQHLTISHTHQITQCHTRTGVEEREAGNISMDVVMRYFRAGGGPFAFLTLLFLYAGEQASRVYTDKWVGRALMLTARFSLFFSCFS